MMLSGNLLFVVLACAAPAADAAGQLLLNADFDALDEHRFPQHWTRGKPVFEPAQCVIRATSGGLLCEAPERPFAVGRIEQEVRGMRGGQAYAIDAACQLHDLAAPLPSVLVRVLWRRGDRVLHPAGDLVRAQFTSTTALFHDVLVAPQQADGARIALEVKWPQGGTVLWKQVTLRAAVATPPRKVKLGTVFLRPKNSTPQENLDLWCAQIDAAGKLGLDAVCLGEAITMVGTRSTAADCAEPIPGPATTRLGQAAARNHLWVVAGLYERDGNVLYNTAVLLDRSGKLSGKYRKIHLPREEWQQGVTPGSRYPVFQTDFGTVGVMICYDWFFPEAAEAFALGGAEVLFAPTWGNTLPDRDGCIDGETTFRVRARDNGLYLVPSVYDGSSMVIDPRGRILASNQGQTGVFWAEVDLNQCEPLPWVGHWRSIGPRDRMPATYGPLLERSPP